MLTPAQSDMIAQIRAKTGPAREATYIAQHKTADSQNAVGAAILYDGREDSRDKIVRVVKHHIKMLDAM